jgi:hypothetical protein
MDAPVNDATVRLHYSVTRLAQPDNILFTTCQGLHHVCNMPETSATRAAADSNADENPFEFTTGEGIMPMGVEMAVKLMLPGEVCRLAVWPDFGLSTCADGDAADRFGVSLEEPLQFVLWLLSFDVEGHPQAMNADQVWALPL